MNVADPWEKLTLRLRSCAYRDCRGHGVAVLSVRLLLEDGKLVRWTEPEIKYTEPRGSVLNGQGSEEAILALTEL